MFAEKKEVKVPSSLPHFMIATAVSKQHQPSVKKEDTETVASVAVEITIVIRGLQQYRRRRRRFRLRRKEMRRSHLR